jgi:GTP-binding protein Era
MKSGFVAIIGRPNVGKSTLFNALMNTKLAAVSPKPQTTRAKISGVITQVDTQIILWDCPGLFQARDDFNKKLVKIAIKSLKEIDLILWLIDCTAYKHEDDEFVLSCIKKYAISPNKKAPIIFLLINKIDKIKKEDILIIIDTYRKIYKFEEIIPISALKGININLVKSKISEYLPDGPQYFPDDILTDTPQEIILSEFIREKIYLYTRKEIPFSAAVVVNETRLDEEKNILYIQADILTNKQSAKKILVGNKGAMIKKIGTAARKDIETFLKLQMKKDIKVYLELFVKVKETWKENEAIMSSLGLS